MAFVKSSLLVLMHIIVSALSIAVPNDGKNRADFNPVSQIGLNFPTSMNFNSGEGIEPSGIVWHPRVEKFFLLGQNKIYTHNFDGTNATALALSTTQMEGITLVDPSSDIIFYGREDPDSIIEYNWVTNTKLHTYDLTAWMNSADPNSGLEGLANGPDPDNPGQRLFYTGMQSDGRIFVFRLSNTSNAVTYLTEASPGFSGISDMFFDDRTNVLWVQYPGKMRAFNPYPALTLIKAYDSIYGSNQEGFCIVSCWAAATDDKVWNGVYVNVFSRTHPSATFQYPYETDCLPGLGLPAAPTAAPAVPPVTAIPIVSPVSAPTMPPAAVPKASPSAPGRSPSAPAPMRAPVTPPAASSNPPSVSPFASPLASPVAPTGSPPSEMQSPSTSPVASPKSPPSQPPVKPPASSPAPTGTPASTLASPASSSGASPASTPTQAPVDSSMPPPIQATGSAPSHPPTSSPVGFISPTSQPIGKELPPSVSGYPGAVAPPDSTSQTGDAGLGTGAVVGITLAAVALVAVLVATAILFRRRSHCSSRSQV